MPAPSLPRALAERLEPVRAVAAERAVATLGAAMAAVPGPSTSAGAVPHTVQYPSTTAPSQPGSAHFIG
jgi:hypothetical protein